MSEGTLAMDPNVVVVVPARPGPLVALSELQRGRDEIDVALDVLFGEPDDRGPGPVDALLFVGGAAGVAAGQVGSLPVLVSVGGAAAMALGAILPLRSLWRRVESARRSRRLQVRLGDGVLLRTDHAHLKALVMAHEQLSDLARHLASEPKARVAAVAHSALREVASLLDGRLPQTQAELDYVSARTSALVELCHVVGAPGVSDGEADRRHAVVEARREVEEVSGRSSLTDAADLARQLGYTDDR
ncbi:MAG: hypothetical protein ACKV2O_01620 [Acidimicrobiales bacterium]